VAAVRHVERRLAAVAAARIAEEPVVALQGPRAVGKSTLVRELADAAGADVIDLDDLPTRAAVSADPTLFAAAPAPVFIDEFQHVPAILDAIKAQLNRDMRAGRFILTGSTHYDSLPLAAQSLTGRLHLLTVWPFSQGEIDGRREVFVERLVDDPGALVSTERSQTTRAQYIDRVVAGGFPIPLGRRSAASRARWYNDYIQLVVERDVLELARIQQRHQLPQLFARLAGQTAQMLNVASAANAVKMRPSTAENYVKLLEAVFLLYRLPAWGTTLRRRAVSTPKLHVLDSGLAAHLLRLSAARLARLDPVSLSEFGHLLETFCVGEIRKQLSWHEERFEVGHWRTHEEQEVDLVIERPDGSVIGVEVKAATSVSRRDFRGLRALRESLADAFVGGVVLCLGERSYTYDERLHVLPVDRLWTPATA
jgi:uncharacterized protein